MKYKVGDKVKLRNDLKVGKRYGIVDFLKGMKCWLNQELTIESVDYENNSFTTEESCYYFSIEMIEECNGKYIKDYTWEDFLECPIGTKITFEDGTILVKSDVDRFDNEENVADYEFIESFNKNDGFGKIIKIEEPTYTTVYEPTEEVEEMTMEEVCKALGKQIKIVKEK